MSARVLVCGGRDYSGTPSVASVLDGLLESDGIACIIQGGATGADADARAWAMRNDVAYLTVQAAWEQHGKAAGPLRNARMLREGKPTLVVAFPGGRGTADMVRKAKAAGVPVREIQTTCKETPTT